MSEVGRYRAWLARVPSTARAMRLPATLAPFHDWETKLPADVVKMVKDKEALILSGDFRVPVNESTPVSE